MSLNQATNVRYFCACRKFEIRGVFESSMAALIAWKKARNMRDCDISNIRMTRKLIKKKIELSCITPSIDCFDSNSFNVTVLSGSRYLIAAASSLVDIFFYTLVRLGLARFVNCQSSCVF
jgi:hypothetical protein